MRKHKISFVHAFEGIIHNLKTQPNFRFHIFMMSVVTASGFYFKVTKAEWIILIFTFSLVIGFEMVNTAIESMTDILTLRYDISAKNAKDTAAGMVLVSAIFAVIIGLVIFIPYLIN